MKIEIKSELSDKSLNAELSDNLVKELNEKGINVINEATEILKREAKIEDIATLLNLLTKPWQNPLDLEQSQLLARILEPFIDLSKFKESSFAQSVGTNQSDT